jgi:hypothetical protein
MLPSVRCTPIHGGTMLVDIDHVKFKVRCPNLRAECYTPEGDFNRDFVFPGEDETLEKIYQFFKLPKRIGVGIYESNLNMHNRIDGILVKDVHAMGFIHPLGTPLPDYTKTPHIWPDWYEEAISSGGVADNVEQVLHKLSPLVNNMIRTFVLEITWMRKKDQSEHGGWRWHKWGEYIGTQQPTCEYLYDEPIIEEVLVYHLHEIKLP